MDVTTIQCGKATREFLADYRDANGHDNYDDALQELLQERAMRFSAQEYAALLSWQMQSDPTPLNGTEQNHVLNVLDTEAEARGYDDWVDAYHEFGMGESDE